MRGIQIAQLSAFVAVAENGSFTGAAKQLGISTSTLSVSIQRLEKQFGVRLLNRTTRSVALTEPGERLLALLNPVLEGVDNAVEVVAAFRDKPAGTLRLSVHPLAAVMMLSPLVGRFASEYPELCLDISIDFEQRDIVSERFDAGIQSSDQIDRDMIAIPICGCCSLSAVASPRYLERMGFPENPDDLRGHNCIGYCKASGISRRWKLQSADGNIEVPVQGSLLVNDPHFALRAALDGVGIVLLPNDWIVSLVSQGLLVRLLPEWAASLTDFVLYYSSRRQIPTKLRTFADFLRRESKSRTSPDLPAATPDLMPSNGGAI